MKGGRSGELARIGRALAAGAAIAVAGGVVVAFLALTTPDRDLDALPDEAPSVTEPPPTELSLVPEPLGEPLFVWDGIRISAADVAAAGSGRAAVEIDTDYSLLIDPDFETAQHAAGLGTTVLRRQLEFIVNRLAPLVDEPGRPTLAIVSTPVHDEEDDALEAALLVFNVAPEERALEHLDLVLVAPDGGALTTPLRFFSGEPIVVPPRTAYFSVVAFAPEDVTVPEIPPEFSFDSEVVWVDPAA